jgi:aminopeptidase N
MWVHEGFANYTEVLFIEYYYGKKAADEYVQGLRANIINDKPVIGHYGVNQEGSIDMYDKGANLLHTIRQVINNDSAFRKILRGLNRDFYHQTTDSKDVEAYFSKQSGKDLSKIFDQYLRTSKIPILEYKLKGDSVYYRWTNCVSGFNMKTTLAMGGGLDGLITWISPTEKWQAIQYSGGTDITSVSVDKNFYVTLKKVK